MHWTNAIKPVKKHHCLDTLGSPNAMASPVATDAFEALDSDATDWIEALDCQG
jgi:hypothetical protein